MSVNEEMEEEITEQQFMKELEEYLAQKLTRKEVDERMKDHRRETNRSTTWKRDELFCVTCKMATFRIANARECRCGLGPLCDLCLMTHECKPQNTE